MRTVLILCGIQVSLSALAKTLSSGVWGRGGALSSIDDECIDESVEEHAERIARLLRERHIIPDKLGPIKLGIDGIPGSGKSTLARALARKLDMEWKSLDYENLGLPGNLGQERTIYEHHRLFRTQDVDVFDAIVYIDIDYDEPAYRSRAKVGRRGRGLILAAVLDYGKLKKVGKLAFDVCEGEPIAIPNSHLVLKIRPPGGFRAVENTTGRLAYSADAALRSSSLRSTRAAAAAKAGNAAGLDPSGSQSDTGGAGRKLSGSQSAAGNPKRGVAGRKLSDMTKEEMLVLLACGRRQDGLEAYLLPLTYVTRMGRLAATLHSAGRRFMTVLCANDSAGDLPGQTKSDGLAPT